MSLKMKFSIKNEAKEFRFSAGFATYEKSEKNVPAEAFLIADGFVGKAFNAVKEEEK